MKFELKDCPEIEHCNSAMATRKAFTQESADAKRTRLSDDAFRHLLNPGQTEVTEVERIVLACAVEANLTKLEWDAILVAVGAEKMEDVLDLYPEDYDRDDISGESLHRRLVRFQGLLVSALSGLPGEPLLENEARGSVAALVTTSPGGSGNAVAGSEKSFCFDRLCVANWCVRRSVYCQVASIVSRDQTASGTVADTERRVVLIESQAYLDGEADTETDEFTDQEMIDAESDWSTEDCIEIEAAFTMDG